MIDITDHTGKTIKMYLYLRPGLQEFLDETSKHFELILFSNGSQVYTEAVFSKMLQTMDAAAKDMAIDDEESKESGSGDASKSNGASASENGGLGKYFGHILCREQCSTNEKGHEIKNLEFFTGSGSNREMRDCIIVDN